MCYKEKKKKIEEKYHCNDIEKENWKKLYSKQYRNKLASINNNNSRS